MSFTPKDATGLRPPATTLCKGPRQAPSLVRERPRLTLPSSHFPSGRKQNPKRAKRALRTPLTPRHGHRVLTAGPSVRAGLPGEPGRTRNRPPRAPGHGNSLQARPGLLPPPGEAKQRAAPTATRERLPGDSPEQGGGPNDSPVTNTLVRVAAPAFPGPL